MNNEKHISNRSSLIVIMGVSGTGKSHIASELSASLGFHFVEADDFHTDESKKRMSDNIPITDEVRQCWFELIRHYLKKSANKNIILAFSGLKHQHRQGLRSLLFNTQFIWLDGQEKIISERLSSRKGHFVSAGFLSGQLKAMEPPQTNENDIIKINIDNEIEEVLSECLQSVFVKNRNLIY
jgi:gluconokinase